MLIGRGSLLVAGALTIFAVTAGLAAFDAADAADRLIRRCSAEGPGDISMAAKYERRDGGRKKFSIEMEAAPGGVFAAGQKVVFFVSGKRVGNDKLQTVVGGDLVGELNLDTEAGPGDDEDPFPANFPPVSKGTKVRIKSGGDVVLACSLR